MSTMIDIKNLSFGYDSKHLVFSSLNLEIKEGESVAIVGANGTGKSTLLRILTGLLGHEGEVKVCGLEVDKRNLSEVRKHLGFVFQDSNNQLFMPTLYDDMSFGLRNNGLSEEEANRKVDEALKRTGIEYLKNRHNHKMSGGERKMASIATILAMEPEIVLFDEPSIALDPYNRRNLINVLNDMKETKVIASHDLDMVYETCDRVILLDEGGICYDGNTDELFANVELLTACHLEQPLFMQKIKRKGE